MSSPRKQKPAVLLLRAGITLLAAMAPCIVTAETPITLDKTVITASQTAHNELSAPASVSVITRQELDKLPVYNLADAAHKHQLRLRSQGNQDPRPGFGLHPAAAQWPEDQFA